MLLAFYLLTYWMVYVLLRLLNGLAKHWFRTLMYLTPNVFTEQLGYYIKMNS